MQKAFLTFSQTATLALRSKMVALFAWHSLRQFRRKPCVLLVVQIKCSKWVPFLQVSHPVVDRNKNSEARIMFNLCHCEHHIYQGHHGHHEYQPFVDTRVSRPKIYQNPCRYQEYFGHRNHHGHHRNQTSRKSDSSMPWRKPGHHKITVLSNNSGILWILHSTVLCFVLYYVYWFALQLLLQIFRLQDRNTVGRKKSATR